jgi:hypothetical protein
MTRHGAALSLPSQLFTVRVWREELEEGRFEWRGKVQHALSGETCYFRSWEDLIEFVQAKGERIVPWEPEV